MNFVDIDNKLRTVSAYYSTASGFAPSVKKTANLNYKETGLPNIGGHIASAKAKTFKIRDRMDIFYAQECLKKGIMLLVLTNVLAFSTYAFTPTIITVGGSDMGTAYDEVDVTYNAAGSVIPSISNTQADAAFVMSFTLADEGADGADLLLDKMTIRKSSDDSFADWTQIIGGVDLMDCNGRSDYTNVNVFPDRMEFSGFDQAPDRTGHILNGASKQYSLYIWLHETVEGNLHETMDGKHFVFELLPNVDIETIAGSSGIRTTEKISTLVADNEVVVTANGLAIVTQPPTMAAAVFSFDPSPKVQAVDANGNWSLRFTSTNFTVTNTANLTQQNAPNHSSIVNGSLNTGSLIFYGSGITRIVFTDVPTWYTVQTNEVTINPTIGLARISGGLNTGVLQSDTKDQAIAGLGVYTVGTCSVTGFTFNINEDPIGKIENIRIVKAATSTYQASDASNVVIDNPVYNEGELSFNDIAGLNFGGDLVQNFFFLVADVVETVNEYDTNPLVVSINNNGLAVTNNTTKVDANDLSLTFDTGNFSYLFEDIIAPIVNSIYPNITALTLDHAAATQPVYSLTIAFNEEMDTSTNPGISFNNSTVNESLTFESGSWTDPMTYIAWYSFKFAEENVFIDNFDVTVANAKDKSGNVQIQGVKTDVFSIDTKIYVLTVVAESGQGKIYGEADPAEFIYTVSGFIGNDDESILSGDLVRAPGEDVGTYAIELGTLNAGLRYIFDYTGADFEITPATITGISFADGSFVYNGTEYSIEVTGTLPDGTSVSYDDNTRADVGTQTVTATISGSNYVDLLLEAELEVVPANITGISFADGSFIFNCNEHFIEITGTLPPGTSVSYDDNTRTDVGVQLATATITGSNYIDLILEAELEVKKITIAGQTDICYNELLNLSITGDFDGVKWFNGIDGEIGSGNILEYIITASDMYWVEVTFSETCTVTEEIQVTVLDLPQINLGGDLSICYNEKLNLSLEGDFTTINWYNEAEGQIGSGNNFDYTITASDRYWVEVTNANNCIAEVSINVSVNSLPEANAGPDKEIYKGESVEIGSTPLAGYIYEWSPAEGLSAINISNPSANPHQTTEYTLKVINAEGCVAYDKVVVNIGDITYSNTDLSIFAGKNILYPNPFVDIINIRFEGKNIRGEYNYQIIDMTGKVVLTDNGFISDVFFEKNIDLSHLASGLYFFKFDSGNTGFINIILKQ